MQACLKNITNILTGSVLNPGSSIMDKSAGFLQSFSSFESSYISFLCRFVLGFDRRPCEHSQASLTCASWRLCWSRIGFVVDVVSYSSASNANQF